MHTSIMAKLISGRNKRVFYNRLISANAIGLYERLISLISRGIGGPMNVLNIAYNVLCR